MSQPSPWWMPDIQADRESFLRARRRVLAALRQYLETRDFAEVETAILQGSPGNEAHLHAFSTELATSDGGRRPLFLHTSPEFACKKLLAAGERRIFEFARVFRNREQGALHHPEFTMLEWYRTGESCEALMDDCAQFLAIAASAAGTDRFSFRGRDADPLAAPERLTVAEAFRLYAGIDLLATLAEEAPDRDRLAAPAQAAGVPLAGERLRARFRPARDAGCAGVSHRAGDLDAATLEGQQMTTNTLRSIAQLRNAGFVPAAQTEALEQVAARYAVAITPTIAELIDRDDPNDPIARQFIPDPAELVSQPHERADPIGDDAFSPVEGIVHRYPDRVLLKLVHTCPVYCRFCFRREMVGPGGRRGLTGDKRDAAYQYIRQHSEIWEVILTGGDPLILPASRLRAARRTLAAIDHVKTIRVPTRSPNTSPEA